MPQNARTTMSPTRSRRVALGLALAFVAGPLLFAEPAKDSTVQLSGKVMTLREFVEKQGAKVDADAATILVLVTDDGKAYPLLKDAASRMYYTDKALRGRPMRLMGRLLPGSQFLQVLEAQSVKNGKPHEIYYWCDVCSIRRG